MNIPDGEIFTAPDPKIRCEGHAVQHATRYQAMLANVRLVFKDGKIVEHGAAKVPSTWASL